MNFEFSEATLPWNKKITVKQTDLIPHLKRDLQHAFEAYYLPTSITLLADEETSQKEIVQLYSKLCAQAEIEKTRIDKRKDHFIQLNLFTQANLNHILHGRKDLQPWIIYHSHEGGLQHKEANSGYGVIPCSSMTNHGLGYERNEDKLKTYLATARKPKEEWDAESDFGHEGAHAAFTPIPFFVQEELQMTELRTANSSTLNKKQSAVFTYFTCELADVVVRGESRDTQTGLPIPTKKDLTAYLQIGHELMPSKGFAKASAAYNTGPAKVTMQEDRAYVIGAPALRIIESLSRFVKQTTPPTREDFLQINNLEVDVFK